MNKEVSLRVTKSPVELSMASSHACIRVSKVSRFSVILNIYIQDLRTMHYALHSIVHSLRYLLIRCFDRVTVARAALCQSIAATKSKRPPAAYPQV